MDKEVRKIKRIELGIGLAAIAVVFIALVSGPLV